MALISKLYYFVTSFFLTSNMKSRPLVVSKHLITYEMYCFKATKYKIAHYFIK